MPTETDAQHVRALTDAILADPGIVGAAWEELVVYVECYDDSSSLSGFTYDADGRHGFPDFESGGQIAHAAEELKRSMAASGTTWEHALLYVHRSSGAFRAQFEPEAPDAWLQFGEGFTKRMSQYARDLLTVARSAGS